MVKKKKEGRIKRNDNLFLPRRATQDGKLNVSWESVLY